MTGPLITLTTDFGEADPFVAAMKGVILSMNPTARVVDLTHGIPPQDVQHAAFFLAEAIPHFPPGTLHVAVVDPGVGSERALLYVEWGEHRLLGPDNGLLTLLEKKHAVREARVLREPSYWRPQVSATFHGRDILAPVAAQLSLGLDPQLLGPTTSSWCRLELPEPRPEGNHIVGEVIHVDHFGNLISNIRSDCFKQREVVRVEICGRRLPFVSNYAAAGCGQLAGLVSSGGYVEVAMNQGSAALHLGAARGAKVLVYLA